VEYKKTKIICPAAPALDEIKWKKITFIVATDDEGLKVIGLYESDYKKLAENTQSALKAIKDRNAVRFYYEKCITDFNKED